MSQFYRTSSFNDLEQGIRVIYEKMTFHQQKGEYQQAEKCRVEWEHRKQELRNKQIYVMQMRHNQQKSQLVDLLNEELKKLNSRWNDKMAEFEKQSQQNIANLSIKHEAQCQKLQETLSLQLSTKVKESSQLLNLRKIEQQMAKQKNYPQAHRVQQKIKKLFAQQQQSWFQKRSQKINQALTNLKNKQASELSYLKQRIKITYEDNIKDQHFQEDKIRQRFQNVLKDMKSQQQRELLSYKGEFRTLGGGSPNSSPNGKSKISQIRT